MEKSIVTEDGRITTDELVALFGSHMPYEAFEILAKGDLSPDEARVKLKKFVEDMAIEKAHNLEKGVETATKILEELLMGKPVVSHTDYTSTLIDFTPAEYREAISRALVCIKGTLPNDQAPFQDDRHQRSRFWRKALGSIGLRFQ